MRSIAITHGKDRRPEEKALYLLACPSTADDIRDDILARADVGQAITHDEIARLNPNDLTLAKLRALGEKRQQKQRLKLGAVAKCEPPGPPTLKRQTSSALMVYGGSAGARRPAGLDLPEPLSDRLRLASSISEWQ